MEILRFHRRTHAPKKIAETVYTFPVWGGLSRMPSKMPEAYVEIRTQGDDGATIVCKFTPEEAVAIGERLAELGRKYVGELASGAPGLDKAEEMVAMATGQYVYESESDKLYAAYCSGGNAFSRGESLSSNPFANTGHDVALRLQWDAGWRNKAIAEYSKDLG